MNNRKEKSGKGKNNNNNKKTNERPNERKKKDQRQIERYLTVVLTNELLDFKTANSTKGGS